MSGSLVTLPLRIGLRVAGLGLSGAQEVARRLGSLAGLGGHDDAPSATEAPEERRTPPQEREPTVTTNGVPSDPRAAAFEANAPAPAPPPVVDAEVVQAEPAVDYDTPTPPEPIHLDEQDEVVEEVAEPGAEDGAGAQIRINEPWDGYRELRAADVVDRLGGASVAELGAIELYEQTTRKRATILTAVQRELRRRG